MADPETPLDRLVAAILASAKYRYVCEGLIRRLGARELAKRRSFKEAVQATRSVLHQVAGAYMEQRIDYRAALGDLQVAAVGGVRSDGPHPRPLSIKDGWRGEQDDRSDTASPPLLMGAQDSVSDFVPPLHPSLMERGSGGEVLREACTRLMRLHASTRERLCILDQFYATILADLAPIRSVLDVACGLNPLAIPWMPLTGEAEYFACDIYADLVGFLNEFLAFTRLRGGAQVVDVTRNCPTERVQVAFLLKSLPCLEQIDPTVGARLLERLNAEHILVSFPVHSLGGRQKGMAAHYEVRFQELVSHRAWTVTRFQFATELVFRVSK
jgi:16S rRNA (guanine(1405)-N(7))-methyltransferase